VRHADIAGKDNMASRIRRIDFGVNCYLIAVECGYVLIDTGFPSKRASSTPNLRQEVAGPVTCVSSC